MNPAVDFFFDKPSPWREAYAALRTIALEGGLTEVLKWGCPCYALGSRNVVLIHGFKGYCALLLFKGALLEDSAGILVQQTANVQAARQLRFTSVEAVLEQRALVRGYLDAATALERDGAQVTLKPTSDFAVPAEFQRALDGSSALREAFDRLTQGRQRGYLLHFAAAKRSETRATRVERAIDRILDGLAWTIERRSTRWLRAVSYRPARNPAPSCPRRSSRGDPPRLSAANQPAECVRAAPPRAMA